MLSLSQSGWWQQSEVLITMVPPPPYVTVPSVWLKQSHKRGDLISWYTKMWHLALDFGSLITGNCSTEGASTEGPLYCLCDSSSQRYYLCNGSSQWYCLSWQQSQVPLLSWQQSQALLLPGSQHYVQWIATQSKMDAWSLCTINKFSKKCFHKVCIDVDPSCKAGFPCMWFHWRVSTKENMYFHACRNASVESRNSLSHHH